MKKIKVNISMLFLMAGFYVQAQDIAIGVRGGISIPNLSASCGEQNPLNTGYSSRLGPEFGVLAEFKISDLFSIEPMVEYSSQGGKKNGMQAFPVPSDLSAMFPSSQAPRPISMPILTARQKSIT